MKGYKSVGVLLSLAATALADPFPSAVDITPLNARGEDGTMLGAMSNLQKRESIFSLMKRGLSEMDGHMALLFPRQIDTIPTDPKTGNTGKSDFDVDLWDQQVEAACADSIGLLTDIVTMITDPAGVAVCYNIPFYNSTSGAFASDIRLYKIANGTKDWEAAGTKVSLSVQYEGATVRLANAPGGNAPAVSQAAVQGNFKATGGESIQQAGKALEKSSTSQKAAQKTSAPANTASAASKSAPTASKSTPAASASSSSVPAAKPAQTPPTAALEKRMNMAQMSGNSDDDDVKSFEPKLLQTMRFVGQVNPNIMKNQTISKNPSIMKLVLTPSLMLIGVTPDGNMNASVAAAQVQYATGAFSSINTPTPKPAPFVLPGVYISIFPLGLYLCIVYTILFVLIVGWGTVERYLFRMSFRKRSAVMNGQDGFGKI